MSKRRPGSILKKNNQVVPKKSCLKKRVRIEIIDEHTGETPIHMLSDDSLAKIFTYLPIKRRLEMEQVCTRWRDVSQQAWHDVKSLDLTDTVNVQAIDKIKKQSEIEQLLARCGLYLTHLSLSSICDSSILPIIRQHCEQLTKLDLELKKYSDTHFISAFSGMKYLNCIKIKNTYGQYLKQALRSLREDIEEIHFGLLQSRNSPGYLHIPLAQNSLTKFTNLRILSVNGHALNYNEVKVISQMQTLVHLNLDFCQLGKLDTCLISDLVNLEHLDLRGVDSVEDSLLLSLSYKCKKLKYLDISLCTLVSDRGLTELVHLENLEELLINDMRRNVTDDPFENFHQLKTLECTNCKYVGDAGIIGLLRKSSNLERLSIARTAITSETLVCASAVTKSRKNDITLHLIADAFVVRNFDMVENVSPFLEIEKD